ncbi:MAG: NfeD family protein [Candidatus Rokubacteria bacterium]|nr:NfeD family protein [Candidatus Rokubacteria bacterium]
MWWCHLLLFFPLLGLVFFAVLPWPVAVGANALLAMIAVGIAVPSIRALRRPVLTGREALLGRIGEAVTDVEREGLVRYAGELWTAVGGGTRVSEGQSVTIIGVQGAKLLVQPLGNTAAAQETAPGGRRLGESGE